jgi:HAD superfamily phosphatase (TIGR01681 family)
MPVWTVFDLDNTLILNTPIASTPNTPIGQEELLLTPYADTQRALEFLTDRGVIITLASFRTNAEEVLRQHGIRQHFAAIEYTRDHVADQRTKSYMIEQLATKLGLSVHDAIFFDDLPENVEECNNQLIYTVPVDPRRGVTLELLFDSLIAALRPPFYIMNTRPLPQEELINYLAEYRVTFLTCGATPTLAFHLTASQPTATVMLVRDANTIELFHGKTQARVTYPDLYECLDAVIAQLNIEQADIPNTVGELIRQ